MSEQTVETIETEQQQPTKAEFEALLDNGRKSLLLENLTESIEQLSNAAVMSVQLFGEFAVETYTPHYFYGKALLELASVEKDVVELKMKDEQFVNDPILGQIKDELKETFKKLAEVQEKDAENSAENETVEEMETTLDETAEANDQQGEIAIDETVDNEEEEEDVENAQLAFESLDYARIVCEKNLNSDDPSYWLERQKNTLVLLAQVAMNDEENDRALEDLANALKIVNEHFSSDFREIAFINMELARVFRKTHDFSSANTHIDNAIQALEQFKAKIEAEPQNDETLLEEIVGLLDDMVGEKNLIRVRESDEKENSTAVKPSNEEPKAVETLAIKRKEKRAANDDEADEETLAKKTKVLTDA